MHILRIIVRALRSSVRFIRSSVRFIRLIRRFQRFLRTRMSVCGRGLIMQPIHLFQMLSCLPCLILPFEITFMTNNVLATPKLKFFENVSHFLTFYTYSFNEGCTYVSCILIIIIIFHFLICVLHTRNVVLTELGTQVCNNPIHLFNQLSYRSFSRAAICAHFWKEPHF